MLFSPSARASAGMHPGTDASWSHRRAMVAHTLAPRLRGAIFRGWRRPIVGPEVERPPRVGKRKGPPTSKFLPSEASLVPRCWTNAVHISVSDISGALPLPLPLPLLGVLFFEEDISSKINFRRRPAVQFTFGVP